MDSITWNGQEIGLSPSEYKGICVSPDGKHIYALDESEEFVAVYDLDGRLQEHIDLTNPLANPA